MHSVAKRFALIGAAGELARDYGVLPWPEGEAMRAATSCFEAWLAERGGAESGEAKQAIAFVREFIEAFGDSRFTRLYDDQTPAELVDTRSANKRAGFRRLVRTSMGEHWEYLFLPEAWKKEVCRGLNPKLVATSLAERGLLICEEPGRHQTKVRIPGHDRVRVYQVSGLILGGGDAE